MLGTRSERILIVEDDIIIREVLINCLEIAGYKTTYALTGPQAIASLHHLPPRAIILDIGLPGLNGFKVLEAVRRNSATAITPVLMLTSSKDPVDVRRAISMGANDYIIKPIDNRSFLVRLERQLRRRSSLTDL